MFIFRFPLEPREKIENLLSTKFLNSTKIIGKKREKKLLTESFQVSNKTRFF